MSADPPSLRRPARAPFHLWMVGLLLVLWNCWGLFGAVAAQARLLPQMPEEFAAYFESQPLWFVLFADLSPLAGVAGAIALLLQSRWAPRLFVVQLVIVALANVYELAVGNSLLLTSRPVWTSTAFLLLMLAAQIGYARHLLKRGYLD